MDSSIPFRSSSFTHDSQKTSGWRESHPDYISRQSGLRNQNKLPITLQLELLAVQKLVEQVVGQRSVDTGAAVHKLVVAVHQSLEVHDHQTLQSLDLSCTDSSAKSRSFRSPGVQSCHSACACDVPSMDYPCQSEKGPEDPWEGSHVLQTRHTESSWKSPSCHASTKVSPTDCRTSQVC